MGEDCRGIDDEARPDKPEFQKQLRHVIVGACLWETRWTEVSWRNDNQRNTQLEDIEFGVRTDARHKRKNFHFRVEWAKDPLLSNTNQMNVPLHVRWL